MRVQAHRGLIPFYFFVVKKMKVILYVKYFT